VERCSFNNLEQLGETERFDYVFSDFGGLNCTDRLDKVLADIDTLLKPGGRFTLVIMPRVCPWEMAMLFKGYFKTAFRRFRKGGVLAKVEGVPFQCYYYDPSYIIDQLGATYTLCSLKGLAVTVPPPYIEHFIERHPRWFRLLERWENKLYSKAPFNRWCDHYMITMEKKQAC
jgi:SAM-dependent methyltransferase